MPQSPVAILECPVADAVPNPRTGLTSAGIEAQDTVRALDPEGSGLRPYLPSGTAIAHPESGRSRAMGLFGAKARTFRRSVIDLPHGQTLNPVCLAEVFAFASYA